MALNWGKLDDNQKSVALYCYNYLVNSGFSPEGACGVLGNIYAESGFNVAADNPNDEGKRSSGLCQWRAERRDSMVAYCEAHGGNWQTNIDGQLGFLVAELTDRQYMPNGVGTAGSDVIRTMQSTKNSYDAAVYWEEKFERSLYGAGERGDNADACYASIVQQGEWKNAPAVTVSAAQSIPYGEALIAAAESEVVYWNNTYGEDGYENNNKYTTWFYGREQPADWCAIFVSYCINEAGITLPFNPSDYECVGGGNGTTPVEGQGCDAVSPWMVGAQATGCWVDVDDLQPGDIVIYSNYHIGIVYAGYGASALTIEGNVSGGEGRLRKYTFVYDTPRLGGIRLNGMSSKVLSSGSNLSYSSSDPIYGGQSGGLSYHEVEVDIKSSHIATANADANTLRTKSNSLLDTPTLVESPFIILKIGNYTFGSYSVNGSFDSVNSNVRVTYPNYMTSIRITKVNGQVNQYIITMVYQIENGNDPNLLDKIFSSVGYGTVYISYGDWNAPKFAYRDEEAIITRLDSNVDFSSSRIIYTLYCTSNALMLLGGYHNFTAGNVKPSQEIHDMMYAGENKYHLQDIFTAFKGNEDFFWKCVASDDVVVEVVPKIGMDALSYVNYLVTCMSPTTTPKGSAIRDANYYLTICEDRDLGTYFTIKKVSSTADIISLNNSDVYEVDVGYPGDTLVTQFKINSNNSWNLLYKYSESIAMPNYVYNIDAQGQIYESYSPNATTSAKYLKTTETQRNWWTQMTQFPIQATLTIKGLLRPAMLMSYVRINAMFYGLRHVSSGLYIIIKQEDIVDMSGYRTTLTLQRIAGDLDVIVTETKTVTKLVPEINYNVNRSNRNTGVGGNLNDKEEWQQGGGFFTQDENGTWTINEAEFDPSSQTFADKVLAEIDKLAKKYYKINKNSNILINLIDDIPIVGDILKDSGMYDIIRGATSLGTIIGKAVDDSISSQHD